MRSSWMGAVSKPKDWYFDRKKRDPVAGGKRHVSRKAEVGVMQLDAKDTND